MTTDKSKASLQDPSGNFRRPTPAGRKAEKHINNLTAKVPNVVLSI